MEMGKPPLQAALDGSQEIGFTIVSMTLSLAAVFIPVLFMGGIVGRLFHEFAVTIGVADPDLRLRLADAHADAVQPLPHAAARARAARPRSTTSSSASSPACCAATAGRCAWSLDHRRLTMASPLVITGRHRVRCSRSIPKGFIPSEDTGQLIGADRDGRRASSFEAMVAHQQQVLPRSSGDDPNVAGVHVERRRPRRRRHEPGHAVHPPQAARASAR